MRTVMYIIKGKIVWTLVMYIHRKHPGFYKKATGPDVLDRITINHDTEVIHRSWPELASKKQPLETSQEVTSGGCFRSNPIEDSSPQCIQLNCMFLPIVGSDPVLTMSRFQSFPVVPSQQTTAELRAGHRESFKLHSHREHTKRHPEDHASLSDWQVCLTPLIGQ